MPYEMEEFSPEDTEVLEAFVRGYFAGYQQGIAGVAELMIKAKRNGAPVSSAAQEWIVKFGEALKHLAPDLTQSALTRLEPEELQ